MAPVKTVFQLATKPSWFENLAVRACGTLLVTRMDVPELWEVDPRTGAGRAILTIPSVSGLTGINELGARDVFVVGGGDYDFTPGKGTVPGTYGLWRVDLRGPQPKASPIVTKMAEIGLLNGTATWDGRTVLAADSIAGVVYKVDVETGAYEVCLDVEAMKAAPGSPFPLGVNGVKVHDGHVYFTSTTRGVFGRVPVGADAKAAGPVEVLAEGFWQDDCCVAADGTAYVVTHVSNMVMRVPPPRAGAGAGAAVVVAGDAASMAVAGGTACALGRTEDDGNVLYVCTSGANAVPVNGQSEGAKIVAIQLDG